MKNVHFGQWDVSSKSLLKTGYAPSFEQFDSSLNSSCFCKNERRLRPVHIRGVCCTLDRVVPRNNRRDQLFLWSEYFFLISNISHQTVTHTSCVIGVFIQFINRTLFFKLHLCDCNVNFWVILTGAFKYHQLPL